LQAKIGDGAKGDAGHIQNMGKSSDKASADFGRNP
jgi:hypothetical protein